MGSAAARPVLHVRSHRAMIGLPMTRFRPVLILMLCGASGAATAQERRAEARERMSEALDLHAPVVTDVVRRSPPALPVRDTAPSERPVRPSNPDGVDDAIGPARVGAEAAAHAAQDANVRREGASRWVSDGAATAATAAGAAAIVTETAASQIQIDTAKRAPTPPPTDAPDQPQQPAQRP